MANKRPAEQWYSGDWFRAVDIRKCSWAVKGLWREMLDVMVNEQEPGKMCGTRREICRVLGCTQTELDRFLAANSAHKFADVTERNGKVTIICRRLYRAYLERIGAKTRVQRYRQKQKRESNGDVTLPSSSSFSSSCNNTVTLEGTTLQQCYDAGAVLGIPEDYAERFYEHYQPQGWKWGNNCAMTDLRGALQRCWSKGYTFKSDKTNISPKAKAQKLDIQAKERIRAEHQEYLESKTTEALLDIKKDGGHLWHLCGWLIEEILAKRKGEL